MTRAPDSEDPLGNGEEYGVTPLHSEGAVGEVPEWAWRRAQQLCRDEQRDQRFCLNRDWPSAICLARMIAAHEPAPVDPLREMLIKAFISMNWPVSNEHLTMLTAELRARLPAAAVAAVEGERA